MEQRDAFVAAMSTLSTLLDSVEEKTIVCFGSLLAMIRDGIVDLDQDIDIGVIGDPSAIVALFNANFKAGPRVLHDVTGKELHATFTEPRLGFTVDLFHWIPSGGFYWHTYDPYHTGKEVLPEYEFKGIPAQCFDVSDDDIDCLRRDRRIGRTMSEKGCWRKLVPGIEEEGMTLPVPYQYGTCLDIWYPDWATKRAQWGVSSKKFCRVVRSCGEV